MFKIGQTIRCINNYKDIKNQHTPIEHLTKGKTYKVIGVNLDEENPPKSYIEFLNDKGHTLELFAMRFELVSKRNLPNWF